ncbi:hypothetical protein [Streptomyces decoyicus]|uniref:hypothetical protein n=1 Tax=Streptomyces decoyicus TaxID=249567 RepID=UPI00069F9596|nr:hypothetical protein [Streptomyces decoyicus]KOG41254.1 hypothetical protein ADK74_22225 [Streptomyces decoyicus]QZY20162.1 hypothetical protein K7C20_37255 [Streptomyces decoyicus]
MNPAGAGPDKGHETGAAFRELEGYLFLQAEDAQARAEAEHFADQLPWLTTGQRKEVVRLCVQDRLALNRRYLERIKDRCLELRGEYSERYERLRCQLLAVVAATFVAAAVLLFFAFHANLRD